MLRHQALLLARRYGLSRATASTRVADARGMALASKPGSTDFGGTDRQKSKGTRSADGDMHASVVVPFPEAWLRSMLMCALLPLWHAVSAKCRSEGLKWTWLQKQGAEVNPCNSALHPAVAAGPAAAGQRAQRPGSLQPQQPVLRLR